MATSSKLNGLESIVKAMVDDSYEEENFVYITGVNMSTTQCNSQDQKVDDIYNHIGYQSDCEIALSAKDFPSSSVVSVEYSYDVEEVECDSLLATINDEKTFPHNQIWQPDSQQIKSELPPASLSASTSNLGSPQLLKGAKINLVRCDDELKDKLSENGRRHVQPTKKKMKFSAISDNNSRKGFKGSQQFFCHIPGCDKVYGQLAHLKRHLDWHTGVKNFVCPYCNNRFGRKDHLTLHMKRHAKAMQKKMKRKEKNKNINSINKKRSST